MEVDFKITTWERVVVPDEHKDEVISRLKDGSITTSNQLVEFVDGKGGDFEYGIIAEAEEQVSLDDNDGYTTIEAWVDKKSVYTNGKNI